MKSIETMVRLGLSVRLDYIPSEEEGIPNLIRASAINPRAEEDVDLDHGLYFYAENVADALAGLEHEASLWLEAVS